VTPKEEDVPFGEVLLIGGLIKKIGS